MTDNGLIQLLREELSNEDPQLNAIKFKMVVDCLLNLHYEKGIQSAIESSNTLLADEIIRCRERLEHRQKEVASLESMRAENEAILIDIENIEKEYERLVLIKEKIKALKVKQAELKKPENDFDLLLSDLSKIDEDTKLLVYGHLSKINQINEVLEKSTSDLEIQLKENIERANANILIICDLRNKTLNTLSVEPLKSYFEKINSELEILIAEYNEYVEKVNSIQHELDTISEKHNAIIESFKQHGFENDMIYGELSNRGEFDGVANFVENLKKQLIDNLKIYDEKIGEVLKQRENLPLFEIEQREKRNGNN